MSAFSDFGVPGLILCRPIDAYFAFLFAIIYANLKPENQNVKPATAGDDDDE